MENFIRCTLSLSDKNKTEEGYYSLKTSDKIIYTFSQKISFDIPLLPNLNFVDQIKMALAEYYDNQIEEVNIKFNGQI